MFASRSSVRPVKAGITKLELFVVLLIIGVLIALLMPAMISEPGPSRRSLCKNNLKQIGLALHNYYGVYGCLPPAIVYGPDGKPWHSWRTLILPFLECQDIYDRYRFDEPWNSPNNRRLAADAETPTPYQCPADQQAAKGATSYVAVTGDDTLWPLDQSLTFDDVADGISRTILVVELSNSGVPWMEPRDLPFDRMTFEIGAEQGIGIRGEHGGKNRWFREDDPTLANVLMGDGSVRTLGGPDLTPETVRSLLLRDDGGPAEESW